MYDYLKNRFSDAEKAQTTIATVGIGWCVFSLIVLVFII
jgi:hypothetical protein